MNFFSYLSSLLFIVVLYYAPLISSMLPVTNFGAGIPDLSFYEISLLFWILCLFLDFVCNGFKVNIKRLWFVCLALYSLIIFLSVYWSQERYNIGTLHDLFYTVLIPFLIAIFATQYVNDSNFPKKMAFHAAIACSALSAIGFFHFVRYSGSVLNEARAGAGALTNPNSLAIYLVLNIPLLLYAMQKRLMKKFTGLSSLSLIFLGVIATISRKGILTLVISYLLYFFYLKHFRKILILILFFSLAGILILNLNFVSQRFKSEKIKSEFYGKNAMALAGWKMFKQKPLLGWGYKGYYNNFGSYFGMKRYKYNAHNNFITALVNYGLIGFSFFMGIFLFPLWQLRKKIKLYRMPDTPERIKVAAGVAFLVPFMLSAWVAGVLVYQPRIMNLFYAYIVFFAYSADNKD